LIKILLPQLRRYALARPNARSSHVEPTPQGAGVAVVVASLVVSALAAIWSDLAIPVATFGAVLFIAFVGFIDDVRPIPVMPRLLLQALSVTAVLFWLPSDVRISPAVPLGIERSLLLIAGLWFVNLVNFMDGLDLITTAEVVPITATMILFGLLVDYPATPTIVAAALCGAMLGFAPFNRPVARVFLGDVGSLPIGLLLGWCLLQLAWHQNLTAALLLPLYYLIDATWTLLRRMVRHEPFWAAHRTHFYQQATDNGFAVLRVSAEVFVLNLALAALATASIFSKSIGSNFALLAIGTGLVALQLRRFSKKRPSESITSSSIP
jgi:UDP-N-acetylmuramyl pentapeptide phosphotransferase/UDP-N-acetylglucosamine-1-phosphate transferase